MSYKTLFCLGVTTLLAASFMPATAVRATPNPTDPHGLSLNTVNAHQRGGVSLGVSLEEYKSMSLVFASEETKSTGVPQGSSRPPRG